MKPILNVAMIGYEFMGRAHSHAWRTAPRFFDLPVDPVMKVLVGRNKGKVEEAAQKLGWEETSTSWEETVSRPDIDLVEICSPGDTHAPIAIAALQSGKSVLCEKPLANSVEEAEAMVATANSAAAANGALAMVGYSYRRVPAIQLARRIVSEGRLGQIHHVRAQYLQDWLVDPETPMTWRLDKDKAGSGALGDIAAHVVDLTQFITGQSIESVSGTLRTFVTQRPSPDSSPSSDGLVTVDDAAAFLANFSGGALGVFEATRFANGRKNAIRIEMNGSAGSLAFDFEDMNVLHFYDGLEQNGTAGFKRILVTEPEHEYMSAWWPTGHGIGYEHAFTHQVVDLVRGIAERRPVTPTFADGLQVQRVLAAVERSAKTHSGWVSV